MTTLEESLSQIPAFSIIHEHLFSSAQPSVEQLKLIKEYGCSTVINLALTIHRIVLKMKIRFVLSMV